MKKTILFDLDGTLIDSTEAILESFAIAFETFGERRPDAETVKAQIGHTLDDMMRSLGVPEEKVWDYVHAYKGHYRTVSCQKTVLLPQAAEAVKLASKHATLGVVTTKTGLYSRELLEHLGLMHYFEVLIGREDVEFPKPHSEPIQKALSGLKVVGDERWMIGDTCMDMQAAKGANVEAAAVTCGYGSLQKLALCTDYIYENALEAVTYIAKR